MKRVLRVWILRQSLDSKRRELKTQRKWAVQDIQSAHGHLEEADRLESEVADLKKRLA